MGNEAKYRAKVLNVNGYTVLYPNVAEKVPFSTFPPDPFAQSSTQLFPLGARCLQGEREWRYVKNGGVALVAGFTVQSAPSASAGHDMDMVTAVAAAGAYEVTVTPITVNVTADQYKEGYLFTNDLTGEGQCFKIKSNPAITAATTGVITLYDPVVVDLDATTLTGLRKNPYMEVIVTPITTLTGIVLGVSQRALTISYYGWIQSKGPAAVHTIGTLVLGQLAVAPTATTAGSVGPSTIAYGEPTVGVVMNVSVTTDKSLIFLDLP